MRSVYPVLEKAACAGCHNHDGVASGTKLQFPETGASEQEIEAFGLSLHKLVDRAAPRKSPLLLKPTRRVAHAGGVRIKPDSDDESVLREWVEHLAGIEAPAAAEVEAVRQAARPILRRLTHAQYNNTIRDLLGDESRLADQFPPEDFVSGFKNQAVAQSISPLLTEAYGAAAERLAKNAFRGGDTRGLIPCKPTGSADRTCAAAFVRSFGKKAFRRPLLDIEVDRYLRLFRTENGFLDGAQLVIEAMLQSPSFLQRAENGSDPIWRPYETASRLSYFAWNSMPDDELLRAAEAGELSSPEGLEKQMRRLLADPRAHHSVNDFLEQWLRFDRLLTAVKDRRSFPQYTPELALAMTEETRRLVSDLVWGNGNFMDFYGANYSYVSSSLANLYGIPAPAEEFEKVVLPAETERAGILGHAVFLALTSKPADTSPTARGLFVREQFLCQEVPQPPPGVSANLPPVTKEKPMTNRERLGVHLSNESCASCHTLIDPIGFGFEKFDAIGQRRELLKLTITPGRQERNEKPVTVELPLTTDGEVAGIPGSRFSTPRELGTILTANTQCQECVVKQLFRYAMGRKERAADRPVIRQAFEDFRASGFRFQELMVALMKWTEFPPGPATVSKR